VLARNVAGAISPPPVYEQAIKSWPTTRSPMWKTSW